MVPEQLEENQSRCRFPSRNEQCGEGKNYRVDNLGFHPVD